jgi:uncharacterized protein YndB with AHSA1/START domain
MAAENSAARESAERELVLTRVFDAPRSLVFKVWTQPEHQVQWIGPQGFTGLSCEMDVRPGGAFRFRMRGPEGTLHCVRGVYREIVEGERLVYTWAWEDENGNPRHQSLVRVTFADEGGKTRITVHHSLFESVTARELHQGGWTSNFERLASYLARIN